MSVAPGCFLWISYDLTFHFATGSSGSPTLGHPVPNVTSVIGVELFEQAYAVESGGRLVSTPVGQFVIGP